MNTTSTAEGAPYCFVEPQDLGLPHHSKASTQVLCGVQSTLRTGQNLFEGNVCVYIEPYGQPAHAKQALKRLHRRAQTRDVYVYRLTCADEENGVLTIRILPNKADARDMFAGILCLSYRQQIPGSYRGSTTVLTSYGGCNWLVPTMNMRIKK